MTPSRAALAGAPPQIGSVLPRGAQRGTDVVVTFSGARLENPLDVLFHEPGITVVGFEPVDAANLRCTLRLSAQAEPGFHLLRLRTIDGVSNARRFSVSCLPELQEIEPNGTREQASRLGDAACVNGAIPPEDVDVFAFHAPAGQTLAFEIEAIRLGDTLFDPRLAILDVKGKELICVDDVTLLRQDAALVRTFEAEGDYFVQVRETAFGGSGNSWYRLHVGSFPRPTACTPSALQAGVGGHITWLGDPSVTTQELPPAAPGWLPVHVLRGDGAVSPTPVPVRVSPYPVALEVEPNNTNDAATQIAVPGGVSGLLGSERDVDCFVFEGVAGQALEARVFARALGSPVDSVLNIRRAGGEGLGGADDSGGPDSAVRFTCPANERVIVEVRDLLFRSGPDFTYHVEIAPVLPALSLTTSRESVSINVPAGNRAGLLVNASRADFGGALKIGAEGLPAAVSVAADVMHESVGQLPLVFEAAADAPPSGALVSLSGEHVDPAKGIRGNLSQNLEMVKYENNPFFSIPVDRLALAVTRPVPFRVEVEAPLVPIVRMGSMALAVRVERAEGFNAPITVRMLWNPPGIASGSLEIPPDKSDGVVPISAAANAAVATWKIALSATADGGGAPMEVSSALISLVVADPMVEFAVQKARTEQGKSVELSVKVEQRKPFEGEAQAALVGLPNGVSVAPLPLTRETQELRFALVVGPEAAPGDHNSVFVHVDIPSAGRIIPHNSPAGQLIVDKPLPPKDPQQEAARQEAIRKAAEEKEQKKAERLAAIAARRAEAEARKQAEKQPQPTQPKP